MRDANVNPRLLKIFGKVPSCAGMIAMVVGAVVLVGWWLDMEVIKRLRPGMNAMNPTAAVAFLFSGLAMWLAPADAPLRWQSRLLALIPMAIGLLRLFNTPINGRTIDGFIFPGKIAAENPPNIIVSAAALEFILINLALVLRDVPRGRGRSVSTVLATVAVFVALLPLTALAYGAQPRFAQGAFRLMALHTAATFLLLALGALLGRIDRNPAILLASRSQAGATMRRLLPPAVLLPLALGWFRLLGEQAGLYDVELGIALFAVSLAIVLVIVIWINSRIVERADVAERALRENEERFRLIVEGARDYAIFALDENGNVATWNAGAERINGYRADEIIGKHFSIFYPPEEAASQKAENELRIAATEGRFEEEGIRMRKDGTRYVANVIVTPLRDEDGALRGYSKITRDITGRKAAEEALAKTMEDLRRTNEELGQITRVTAHDLQEPLRLVASYLQLIERRYAGTTDADLKQFIGFAVEGARRMKSLLRDLLAFVEIGRWEKQPQPVDTAAACTKAIESLRDEIDRTGAIIECGELPTVPGFFDEIEAVFYHLISNGIKFAKKGDPPRVHVVCELAENEWLFAVRDEGIGIEPEFFGKIFVLFQRLHPREYPGTGIGLALCKKIVERHGGRLWLESEPGAGATFYFALPAVLA